MRLFIHALGASAGGGLTYLRNVVPQFASHPEVEVALLAGPECTAQISPNVHVLEREAQSRRTMSRFLWEQRVVPHLIRRERADVLLCTGNFAIWKSPVPQILLSRNSLYTSQDFLRDLRSRHAYGLLADTYLKSHLARKSVQRAEITVAPSEAFAQELAAWAARGVRVVQHGFDREQFFQDPGPLPQSIASKLQGSPNAVRLLFVSHYNYYRNFETLFRGLALLKQRDFGRRIQLVLTCALVPDANPGSYRTERASELIRELQISGDVIQLGAMPYPLLHHVYRSCQIYVTPAYTETFAHPLVEAMACGLPIVASDLAVHREVADGAGLFFERFSPRDLADKLIQLVESPSLQSDLRSKGIERCAAFSWKTHVDSVLELAIGLAN
jgi:glycosyltransferase involved in cell wall biosynthesis